MGEYIIITNKNGQKEVAKAAEHLRWKEPPIDFFGIDFSKDEDKNIFTIMVKKVHEAIFSE